MWSFVGGESSGRHGQRTPPIGQIWSWERYKSCDITSFVVGVCKKWTGILDSPLTSFKFV